MTPVEVRELITARIEALPTTGQDYAQGNPWKESVQPLIPEFDPDPQNHLSFFVDDRELSLQDTRENAGESLLVVAPLRVRFLFRLRPTNKKADWDLASTAVRALWRHLLTESGNWNGELNLFSPDSGTFVNRQIVGEGGGFCVVTLFLTAEYSTEAV